MTNKSRVKTPVREQAPKERARNFDEVVLGYSEAEAVEEARRCLGCKDRPCASGCPVGIDIPAFVRRIAERDFDGAYDIVSRANALPAACGRVCPQETQCEGRCLRGKAGEPVAIGRLERFVADRHNAMRSPGAAAPAPEPNGFRAAVIGSGPAGLTCAGELAGLGCDVTVFEALHEPGGVLAYGIPEFRLPKSIVRAEIESLKKKGVKIRTNVVVGRTCALSEICAEYDATFVGTGAGLPRFLGIPGENLCGVYSSNEFLTRINLMNARIPGSATPICRPKRAVVAGGGNVAMDAARSALRLGAETIVAYRRTENELPARREEVEHAKEEGIRFEFLATPVEAMGDGSGRVRRVRCQRMALGEPDSSGRRRPVPIDEFFELEADCLIVAVGTTPNPTIRRNLEGGPTFNARGGFVVDASGSTDVPGLYAGGDAVTGAATVISAMGAGKRAARGMFEFMKRAKARDAHI